METSTSPDDALRDPVMQRMRRLSTPFCYDQQMYVDAKAGDLWEEQAPFGYRTGIAVPLHLPRGRHFLFGVDRDEPLPDGDNGLTALLATLQLMSVHAQEAFQRLLPVGRSGSAAEVSLTSREREVLNYYRIGKNAVEVGMILGISRHTVRFFCKNILGKLDAVNMTQAVTIALDRGLIR